MTNPLTMEFLNEPFYRWVIFIIALGIALAVWNKAILGLMG